MGLVIFKFSKGIYSKHSLIKAAYSYVDDYYVHLDEGEKDYIVELEPKQTSTLKVSEKDFLNEMLVQEVRNIVEDKTYRLREMIYARALASTIIDDSDYSDDLNCDNSTNSNLEDILVDWFEKNE